MASNDGVHGEVRGGAMVKMKSGDCVGENEWEIGKMEENHDKNWSRGREMKRGWRQIKNKGKIWEF
uniref:Uncharacterized protein n=1 Tax=Cucumis melo TaxID=3656 RepID=A0A9I9DKX2_CUCME